MSARSRITTSMLFVALVVGALLLAIGDLLIGTTPLSIGQVWSVLSGSAEDESLVTIVWRMRMPKVLVALFAGMALSASGLQMQTLFRNPLAGPYVLGVNSGASLGVALFTLAMPMLGVASASWLHSFGVTGMAWMGSAVILLLVISLSRTVRNINTILIIGMMLSSAISALVGILQYIGTEESLKAFVVWTMGSVSTVTVEELWVLIPVVIVGLVLSIVVIKPLNMLLLGENYARTMGLNVSRTRAIIFLSTTLLAGTVTAFCGPIGFIGLAMPHLARITFRTADHRVLMPATMLWGALSMLFCTFACDIVARQGVMLPVNTITSLLGIPVIIYVVLRNSHRQ
ncbi:MAG: iron ABC transporter permease [Rikenellaceae bacterium]|nr:iron ABC transporter permease [Rikenellaceae bacterium]